MKKKLLSILLAGALALSVTACSGSDSSTTTSDDAAGTEAVHLTLAHADAADGSLFGECTKEFKAMVEEKSNGSIIVDIYPNGHRIRVCDRYPERHDRLGSRRHFLCGELLPQRLRF